MAACGSTTRLTSCRADAIDARRRLTAMRDEMTIKTPTRSDEPLASHRKPRAPDLLRLLENTSIEIAARRDSVAELGDHFAKDSQVSITFLPSGDYCDSI